MKLLDLYCGAGGASVGYHRAGFDKIVGVDIHPQPHYPYEFHQADAIQWDDLHGYDLIHASPPCQFATAYRRRKGVGEHAINLIPDSHRRPTEQPSARQ